jgi:Fe-S-cluster-containing hydrogenase component 2
MNRKVLVFEPKKCIGCRLCENYCSFIHEGVINPAKARIRIIRDHETQIDLATYCHSCFDAPCIKACNFDALSRHLETNSIQVSTEECVGCRKCIEECPFVAPSMDPTGEYVYICDLCNGDPECVKICPEEAIHFVDVARANNIYKSIFVEEMAKRLIQEED